MKNTIETIRLLVADDHPVVLKGFEYLFSFEPNITILASVSDGRELMAAVKEHRPDVVITDVKMPRMDGREACAKLKEEFPETGVIIYSGYDDAELICQMRKAGVKGYLLKEGNGSEICKAVRVVYEGGEYYCHRIQQRINQLFHCGKLGYGTADKKKNFTEVELAIIKLICKELSSKEISKILKLTVRNVEYHKTEIEKKMDVKGLVGIAMYAVNNYLL